VWVKLLEDHEKVHDCVVVKVSVQLEDFPRLRDALADGLTLRLPERVLEGVSDGGEWLRLLLGEEDWLLV